MYGHVPNTSDSSDTCYGYDWTRATSLPRFLGASPSGYSADAENLRRDPATGWSAGGCQSAKVSIRWWCCAAGSFEPLEHGGLCFPPHFSLSYLLIRFCSSRRLLTDGISVDAKPRVQSAVATTSPIQPSRKSPRIKCFPVSRVNFASWPALLLRFDPYVL